MCGQQEEDKHQRKRKHKHKQGEKVRQKTHAKGWQHFLFIPFFAFLLLSLVRWCGGAGGCLFSIFSSFFFFLLCSLLSASAKVKK